MRGPAAGSRPIFQGADADTGHSVEEDPKLGEAVRPHREELVLEEATLGPKLGHARKQQYEREKKVKSRTSLSLCGQCANFSVECKKESGHEGQGSGRPWRALSRGGVASDLGERAQMCCRAREGLLEEESPLGGWSILGRALQTESMYKGPGAGGHRTWLGNCEMCEEGEEMLEKLAGA